MISVFPSPLFITFRARAASFERIWSMKGIQWNRQSKIRKHLKYEYLNGNFLVWKMVTGIGKQGVDKVNILKENIYQGSIRGMKERILFDIFEWRIHIILYSLLTGNWTIFRNYLLPALIAHEKTPDTTWKMIRVWFCDQHSELMQNVSL